MIRFSRHHSRALFLGYRFVIQISDHNDITTLPSHHSNILRFSPPHHSIILTWISWKPRKPFHHSNTSFTAFFTWFSVCFFCTVISPQTTDSLFQGKPLSRESFPENHFSRELFHKTSFQSVIVPTRIFSKKIHFSVGLCFSKNYIFRGTFFKGTLFRGIVPQNPPCQGNQSVRCVGISNPYLQTSFQETVSKACFFTCL